MPYWAWYVLIGLSLASCLLALTAKEIWVNVSKKAKGPAYIQIFRSYALTFLFTTAIWPFIVPFIIYEKWMYYRDRQKWPSEERIFAPTKVDLMVRLSAADIEANELILDPLGGAPRLPFGHLNEAWRNFLTTLPSGTELWSYAAVWENRWHAKEQREGYVAVMSGEIGLFFETVGYRLDNQA
jgi:hypothetical protein